MAFEIPKQTYSGTIREVTIGTGPRAITLGGESSYPFYLFEGNIPNPPKIAMEIWDYDPSKEWPAAAVEPFKEVMSSPEAWAKKCVEGYGADLIVLQLKSTDPNGMDRSADEAAEVAKKVSEAVEVPLVIWGTANNQKDEDVLKKISEVCQGKNVALAPVEEGNHKGIGASALGYGHTVVASTPIDVNLAKQLNILLGNLGVPMNKMLIDPTTGGLGYGIEYSYSVMERIRMAALTQEDDKLQVPMICNIGNEIWKCKEVGQDISEAPTMGDPERRAILMETVSAVCYLLGGADVVVLRHPETVRLVRSFIELLIDGSMATEVAGISKRLEVQQAELLSISPEPNLDFGEKEAPAKGKAGKPKKAAALPEKKKEKPAPPPEPEKKVLELKPTAVEEAKKKAEAMPKVEAQVKPKTEEDAKKKAEEDAKAKAEAEAEARAEEEARAKVKAEAEAKAEIEAKAKEQARAKAEAEATQKKELEALRKKRAQEKQKSQAQKEAVKEAKAVSIPPIEELAPLEKLIEYLDHIHRRA